MSSLSLLRGVIGRCGLGRRDSGDEYCVADVALSLITFCDELKLNRGTEAN